MPIAPSAKSKRPRKLDVAALSDALARVVAQCDVAARLANDPVQLVRAVPGGPLSQELAGLMASSLAFGNVKTIRASITNALGRLGPELPAVLDDPKETFARLSGFRHRMLQDEDIGRLLVGARTVQRRYGTLGEGFAAHLQVRGELRGALLGWTEEVRQAAGLVAQEGRRGPAHVLSSPAGNSGCKRLLLYLRWMVRPQDGVDLGLWAKVPASLLLIPVDTHIYRLGFNVGMTDCAGPSWTAAEQITAVLRQIDPGDPVRFDFALCHLGMARGCPSAPVQEHCEGCGIREVCRYWR